MPPKRKQSTGTTSSPLAKRSRNEGSDSTSLSSSPAPAQNTDPLRRPHRFSSLAEQHGIVLRDFYPPEMSNERALAYTKGDIPRPYDRLRDMVSDKKRQQVNFEHGSSVIMWFRTDLRVQDNRALDQASQLAHRAGVPLIALYLLSPQDFEAHLTAPARIDFIYRHLAHLRESLSVLDIPLQVVQVPNRANIPTKVRDIAAEWGARHAFANQEYEVDELRRDMKTLDVLHDSRVAFWLFHDTCVVEPGILHTGAGNQYAVYTPWYRSWCRHLGDNPSCLKLAESPKKNHVSARERFSGLFNSEVPDLEISKDWTVDYRDKIRYMWPAGEEEAYGRLVKFCENKIAKYGDKRDSPSQGATSSLSPYLAVGSLSARTCVKAAQDCSNTKGSAGGSAGIQTWISEVAWRDFYRHIMAHWPHVSMHKPFKPEFSNIKWSYDEKHFKAWCEGRTGYPIVDAAMRQLNQIGWMHNRCRMVVASFLCKDLLLDWRMGERYFMEHLIDGDHSSNNGGWGWSASVGADPQPYFRIFNPLLQSERYDPDGTYIRTWVPELKNIKGKPIHDPYGRGASIEAKKKGYPKPMVEHKIARERALKMHKERED